MSMTTTTTDLNQLLVSAAHAIDQATCALEELSDALETPNEADRRRLWHEKRRVSDEAVYQLHRAMLVSGQSQFSFGVLKASMGFDMYGKPATRVYRDGRELI